MSEINRKYLSEPKGNQNRSASRREVEEAVRGFLMRNSRATSYFKGSKMEWSDIDRLTIHLSCANNKYTMAIAMLQLCFVDTKFGYVSYRSEDNMTFSIAFNHGQNEWSQIVEYLDRVNVSVSVEYKGELV